MNNLASKVSSSPVGDLSVINSARAETMNFEEAVLPHMDAAYNLARWLTRNDDDAEDVVQESYLRALKFFGAFHGSEGRPWLLTIVRNTCYTWLKRNRSTELAEFDEATYHGEIDASDPEASSVRSAQKRLVREALERLPVEFREVMVMRELEELLTKRLPRWLEFLWAPSVTLGARAQETTGIARSTTVFQFAQSFITSFADLRQTS